MGIERITNIAHESPEEIKERFTRKLSPDLQTSISIQQEMGQSAVSSSIQAGSGEFSSQQGGVPFGSSSQQG